MRPLAFRSPPRAFRQTGIWRPLAAVLGGLLIPALIAWPLLMVAGLPGVVESSGLRQGILIVLTVLAMAPVPGWVALPLVWPLVYTLYVRGWAGLAACVLAACAVGLPAAHWVLNGDVTTEAPAILPMLIAALAIQGFFGWVILWARQTP
ncbi:hypothetical protein [Cognatishimia sp. F0-27]|uniref:hypothetical protein n=1 Tax=Cognatishimia sp. F0-27 TaxID=2816855 RepID=UPI001D0C84D4|nr:hypothetical protein [Cognatishimia sp. F0-27]MCC1492153.1 hypothetical protein [Cognatishimia sp. F0-27]